MVKEYNYIIARFWNDDDNHLCEYSYFNSAVCHGTKKEAEEHAESISMATGKVYKPYYIITDRD